jgi:protein TonB
VAKPPPAPPPKIAAPSSDPLRPVMRTHTLPPYPPISVRLNEQGTTLMEVHITTEGNVDECKVLQTSSSDRLDQAACEYVKSRWRWQPPTNQGAPVAVSTRVSVKWDLKDAK